MLSGFLKIEEYYSL